MPDVIIPAIVSPIVDFPLVIPCMVVKSDTSIIIPIAIEEPINNIVGFCSSSRSSGGSSIFIVSVFIFSFNLGE